MFDRYHTAYTRMLSLSNLEKTWKHSSPEGLELSMKRIRQLLKRLGNPEKTMRYLHVTGTSGKGSVTNLLHHILLTSGETVASYTSPHTTTYLERFHVNGRLPHPDALADAMEETIRAHEEHMRAGNEPLTFFELNVCNAFALFANEGVSWCVLEVGMGGRFDATNVIPAPAVALITNIDLDHTDYLGDTKELIAYEKAGIIKPGCIAITGETAKSPLDIIKAEAKKHGAPLIVIPNDSNDHRKHNADLARAAAHALGIPEAIIENGIERAPTLPCRFETIQQKPTIIIDGAHNAAKMRATVATIKRQTRGKVHVIFGCKQGKDAASMIKDLSTIATSVRTTRYTQGNGRPDNPFDLLKKFPKRLRQDAFLFPLDALHDALKHIKKSDTLLITGSLYLAGELRAHWRSESTILKERKS